MNFFSLCDFCPVLRSKIDSMWNTLSSGQFGLSVQKELYSRVDRGYRFEKESWSKFARSVGWLQKFYFDPFKRQYYPQTRGNLPFEYLTKVKYKMSFIKKCQFGFVWFIFIILFLFFPRIIIMLPFLQPIIYPISKLFFKRLYKPWYTFAQLLST